MGLVRNTIGGQFAPRLVEMLESPAYRVLSLAAQRVISRIEVELAHHAGKDNGRLPVTYDDFQAYGIDRHAIRPAVREVVALGFVEITERGRAGNAEFGRPNLFRLTFRVTGRAPETNEWKRFQTVDEARSVARRARGVVKAPQARDLAAIFMTKQPFECVEVH